MGQAALQYDEFEDIEPIEVPAGGIASFLTATEGSWATDDEDDLPQTGIAQVKRVADQLATYGRHEDEYMIHAAEGETVIPMEVFRKNPILKDRIFQQMRDMGIEPERYVVGNELNSLNPVTGQPEFFLKKLFSGLKKFVKKAVTVVLPIVGAAFFGPLGAAAGSGIATLINGGNLKDALKSAAISGLTAGVMNGISGGMSAAGEGGSFFQGAKAGAFGEGALTRTVGEAAAAGGAKAAEAAAVASSLESIANPTAASQAASAQQAQFTYMPDGTAVPVAKATPTVVPRPLDAATEAAFRRAAPTGTTTAEIQALATGAPLSSSASSAGAPSYLGMQDLNPQLDVAASSAGTTASTRPPIITSEGVNIGSDLESYADAGASAGAGVPPTGPAAGTTVSAVPTATEAPGVVDSFKRMFGIGPEQDAEFFQGARDLFMPSAGQRAAIVDAAEAAGLKPGTPEFTKFVAEGMKASASLAPSAIRRYAPGIVGLAAFDSLTREEPTDFNVDERVTGFDLREQNPYTYELGPGTMRLPSTYTIQDVSNQYTPIKAPVYQPVPLGVAQGGEIDNFPRMNGPIEGPGTETSDDIPAMLSDGEFVFTAKAVRGAGNGSRQNGMKNMYDLMSKFERMA